MAGASTTAIATAAARPRATRQPGRRRFRATATTTADATTAIGTSVTSPNGRPADHRATPANHQISRSVRAWRREPEPWPRTPATSPAGRPHVVTRPAAGTANRLAGTDT